MPKTVQALYEDGVFKPLAPVELPEHCVVEFEPRASGEARIGDLSTFWGALRDWREDPIEFQRQARGEWE